MAFWGETRKGFVFISVSIYHWMPMPSGHRNTRKGIGVGVPYSASSLTLFLDYRMSLPSRASLCPPGHRHIVNRYTNERRKTLAGFALQNAFGALGKFVPNILLSLESRHYWMPMPLFNSVGAPIWTPNPLRVSPKRAFWTLVPNLLSIG